ncbi:MAG: protein kinase [Phycisphaerales bacterium]|nr:protein kinase [Phycisphaerales bacterium]
MLGSTGDAAKPVGWSGYGQPDLSPGDLVGHFEIEACVGEGGFGLVYRARQVSPIKRIVAIKLLKSGVESLVIIRRFELERQALAQLAHPNIARIYEAGQTNHHRPYVAMEYVDGLPITTYCEQHSVSLEGRLELFSSVCAAVQHAHERGFIHRDLKPANILVTTEAAAPVAKVIDFGIAKAISSHEPSEHTKAGQVVGTLDYMSPEQLLGTEGDIDTRSDVYALGVVLYELLTADRPFGSESLSEKGHVEAHRIVSSVEPIKPSLRSRQLALGKHGDRREAHRLSYRSMRGDLDWIVMRCLEKDRQRRYESALAIRDEIQRVLNNQPVEAGPPGRIYHAKKFVRRHRPLVFSSIAIFLMLLAAVIATSVSAVRERAAKAQAQIRQAEAEQQAAQYQAMAEFMQESFSHAMPHLGRQYDTTLLRMMLDSSVGRIEERFQQVPLAEAQVRMTFGLVYQSLGQYIEAERHLRAASEIRQANLSPSDPRQIQSKVALGIVLNYQGRIQESMEIFRDLLATEGSREAMTDAEYVAVLLCTSKDRIAKGQYEEGLTLAKDARQRSIEAYGKFDIQSLNAFLAVSYAQIEKGNYTEAAREIEEVMPRLKAISSRHPSTLYASSQLAIAYAGLGHLDEAKRMATDAKDMTEFVLGAEAPQFKDATLILAKILIEQRELQAAIELLESVASLTSELEERPSLQRQIRATLARAQLQSGDAVAALTKATEALEEANRQYGLINKESVQYLNLVAACLYEQGQLNEIVSLYRQIALAEPSSAWQVALKEQAIMDCCNFVADLSGQQVDWLCGNDGAQEASVFVEEIGDQGP